MYSLSLRQPGCTQSQANTFSLTCIKLSQTKQLQPRHFDRTIFQG